MEATFDVLENRCVDILHDESPDRLKLSHFPESYGRFKTIFLFEGVTEILTIISG